MHSKIILCIDENQTCVKTKKTIENRQRKNKNEEYKEIKKRPVKTKTEQRKQMKK